MPKIPSLLEMLQSGVHFGHQKSKWYPKMKPFIFTERNGVHIINLEETQRKLVEALEFVKKTVANRGVIVFVGTKKQAQALVKEAAIACGMPYVSERWLGGTLTNFVVISRLIQKYKMLQRKKQAGELDKYTKKEQLEFDREIERLEKLVGGISALERLPNAMFIVDMKKEKTALAEAIKQNIPRVALCDTNTNPEKITYPIPANDDATKSIALMLSLVSEAVKEGKLELEKKESEQKEVVKQD